MRRSELLAATGDQMWRAADIARACSISQRAALYAIRQHPKAFPLPQRPGSKGVKARLALLAPDALDMIERIRDRRWPPR